MSKPTPENGFTLVELIVVLFIISVMVAFTIPELSQRLFRDDTEIAVNWIVFNVAKLKKQASNQGEDFLMCLDLDRNAIQIRKMTPDPESEEKEILSEFLLADDVSLDGVDFKGPGPTGDLLSCIGFYKKGYSDHAIVHVSDMDGENYSCLIQPFLHRVRVFEQRIQFD